MSISFFVARCLLGRIKAIKNTYYNTHIALASPVLQKSVLCDRSEIFVKNVVTILVESRRSKDLSMNKLAWMSGLSPKAIAFIEQGINSPTLRNVIRLADALEIPISELFSGAENLVSAETGKKPSKSVEKSD